MKWFSFKYVKQNPLLFAGIILVFGILFYMLFNRGAPSNGTSYVTSGKSDSQVAAEAQLSLAQMQLQGQLAIAQTNANVESQRVAAQLEATRGQSADQLALAGLELQYRQEELAASQEIAQMQSSADLIALQKQMEYQLASQVNQNAFTVDYASLAYDAATEQTRINAALQRDLADQQLKAFSISSALGVIPTLKKGDRDAALISVLTGAPSSHGAIIGLPVVNPPISLSADTNSVANIS